MKEILRIKQLMAQLNNMMKYKQDNVSKQKALDADSRAIQQIIFTGTASAALITYYILE